MKTQLTLIAVGVLLFVASIVGIAVQHRNASAPDRASAGMTVMLIDATDPPTAGHRAWLTQRLRQVGERMRRGERLTVYVLSGQSSAPRELLTITNPGRARDAALLTEGGQVLDRRFTLEVLQPVDSLMTVAARCDTSRQSAILEALWQISNYSDFARETGPRHLVLVSDLLQNTPGFSLYAPGSSDFFTPAGKLRDSGWEARLGGTTVEVFCLLRPRDEALQGPALIAQWVRYFKHCGVEPTISVVAS